MKKIYIASAIVLVFLAALAIDWNVRQSASLREARSGMIKTRVDDLLELEIGFADGKNPAPPDPAEKKQSVKVIEKTPNITYPPAGPGNTGPAGGDTSHRIDSDYILYEVKPGDTVSEISSRLLGTARRADEILRLNGIDDARKVRAGTTIKVPRR